MSLPNKPGSLHTDWLHCRDSETHEQRSVANCDPRWFMERTGAPSGKTWGSRSNAGRWLSKSNSSQSNDSLEKTPMDGKDRRQEEKEATEDEMVGWHHRLNQWTLSLSKLTLACCSPWGRKEVDATEWLNSKVMSPLSNTAVESQHGLKRDLELC